MILDRFPHVPASKIKRKNQAKTPGLKKAPKSQKGRTKNRGQELNQTPSHIDKEEERYMIDTRGMITSFHLILSHSQTSRTHPYMLEEGSNEGDKQGAPTAFHHQPSTTKA